MAGGARAADKARLAPWLAQIAADWRARKPVWMIAAETGLTTREVEAAVAAMGLPVRCPATRRVDQAPRSM